MKNVLISFLIFFFCVADLRAQETCDNALYSANKLYESGKISDCIKELENCLSNMSKEVKAESYRLLAMAYLANNNSEKSREYVKKLLKEKPDYQRFPNIDPVALRKIVDEYSVTPSLLVGLKAGINRTGVQLVNSYAVYKSPQQYLPVTGFQLGLSADYFLKKNIAVSADLLYSGVGIHHVVDSAGGWKQNYNEQQNYFALNILGKYRYSLKEKIIIHAGVGVSLGYLSRTNVFFESTNLQTESTQQATQNPLAYRNRFQPAALGVLGVSLPLANGFLGLEVAGAMYFRYTAAEGKRYEDLNFIFNNQYVNDDIRLRLMMVNISYKLPILWSIKAKK